MASLLGRLVAAAGGRGKRVCALPGPLAARSLGRRRNRLHTGPVLTAAAEDDAADTAEGSEGSEGEDSVGHVRAALISRVFRLHGLVSELQAPLAMQPRPLGLTETASLHELRTTLKGLNKQLVALTWNEKWRALPESETVDMDILRGFRLRDSSNIVDSELLIPDEPDSDEEAEGEEEEEKKQQVAPEFRHAKTDYHAIGEAGDDVIADQRFDVNTKELFEYNNPERMQIPDFFHLSTPNIERHAQNLKPLCEPWTPPPEECVLRFETREYLGPKQHAHDVHPSSAKVVLKVGVDKLRLKTPEAREKLLALVQGRYSSKTRTLTLVGTKYPTKHLNKEHLRLLLRTLVTEANKTDI